MVSEISGAQYVRRRQEKASAILVAIIVVFLLCHIHRLVFRIYELAHPEKAIYEHYKNCIQKGTVNTEFWKLLKKKV